MHLSFLLCGGYRLKLNTISLSRYLDNDYGLYSNTLSFVFESNCDNSLFSLLTCEELSENKCILDELPVLNNNNKKCEILERMHYRILRKDKFSSWWCCLIDKKYFLLWNMRIWIIIERYFLYSFCVHMTTCL